MTATYCAKCGGWVSRFLNQNPQTPVCTCQHPVEIGYNAFGSPTGWLCPACGRGNAPTLAHCPCYAERAKAAPKAPQPDDLLLARLKAAEEVCEAWRDGFPYMSTRDFYDEWIEAKAAHEAKAKDEGK